MGVIIRSCIAISALWLVLIFGGYLLSPSADADEQLMSVILFAFVPLAVIAAGVRLVYWIVNGR